MPLHRRSNFLGTFTWATLPAVGAVAIGAEALVSDIGPARTLVYSDGTYWRVFAPVDVFFDATLSSGTTSGSDQVVKSSGALAVKLLRLGRSGSIKAGVGKNGANDAFTAVRIRLGTANSTADAAILTNTGLGATIRSAGIEAMFNLNSATETNKLGSGSNSVATWSNGGSSSTLPVTTTIADVDANVLYAHVDIDLAGTTDTPEVRSLIVTVHP